jgi:hypothetical protein
LKAFPIEKSWGLYKYLENKPPSEILKFIDALEKSGNHRTVLVLKFRAESQRTAQLAQQGTGNSNLQPSSDNQPSASRPHDSATKTNLGSSGNNANPIHYNVIENSC